jgi:hypothetical protein
VMTIKTDEPVTWKLGDDLLIGTEFARVELLDPLIDEEPSAWECNWHVSSCAGKITDKPGRAARLIRESDRLESYWVHLVRIHEGEEVAGTPFDEKEWSEDYARQQARDYRRTILTSTRGK